MTQSVGRAQHPERSDRVDEQRMRTVEGVDVAQIVGQSCPAGRLNRSGHLQSELAERLGPTVPRSLALAVQTQKIAVGADVVEAVVVYADMADVGGHGLQGALDPSIQELFVLPRVELKKGRSKPKPLCPLGPAPCGVFALHRKNRGP
ncbi:hypothetical protein ES707_16826 [subsurface metagenome]